MYTKQPKKLIIMNILDILKRYTDENHRLSQKEIQDILEHEYEMKVDRKAIKRNLMNLIDFGYYINYSESVRVFKDKDGKEQENVILTDFHLKREFTDSELRLLIDSVLFSTYIPYKQDMDSITSSCWTRRSKKGIRCVFTTLNIGLIRSSTNVAARTVRCANT